MKILIFLSLLFEGKNFCSVQPVENQLSCVIENQDQIEFYGFNKIGVEHVELTIDNDTQLKGFIGTEDDNTLLFVYFPDIGGNGLEKWIQDDIENLLNASKGYVLSISVNYKELVLNKTLAIRSIELIANRTVELLLRIHSLFPSRLLYLEPIGHGFGAIIAASVAERIARHNISSWPDLFTVLDPEIIDPEDPDVLKVLKNCNQIKIPQIHKGLGRAVFVLHTSTCLHTPVIPACNMSTTDTMGYSDFYPNGGGTQPGCLPADLLCSRNRAAELYVEINAIQIYKETNFYVCPDLAKFQSGTCDLCQPGPCYEMSFYFGTPHEGRNYFYTNSAPPYARGNQTSP